MKFLWLLAMLANLCIDINGVQCPNGSIQMPNENKCLYFIGQNDSNQRDFYFDSARKCVALGGLMAKIENLYENSYIVAMLGPNSQATYIGVERKKNDVWTYTDGSSLTYQNWGPNEPNVSNNNSACAIIDPLTGKWKSAECFYARPFVCKTDGGSSDPQCPDGWLYNQTTDFCYYLRNFTYEADGYWKLYNVSTAESICQEMGAHLVSIHSDLENDIIFNLVTSNVAALVNVTLDYGCSYQRTFIGYIGEGTTEYGNWTDGSPVDYFYVDYTVTCRCTWMIENDTSCSRKDWVPTYQPGTARFVCKQPSKNRFKKEKQA